MILSADYSDLHQINADITAHGCISGMVSSFKYNSDTHAFFDRQYDEIEGLGINLESNGVQVQIQGDMINWFAWLAFEATCNEIFQEAEE